MPVSERWYMGRPPTPAGRRQWNGLAIAALVLALLWLLWLGSLLGVIFGLIAHRQIKRSGGGQRGNGLAIAGTAVGAVGLLLLVVGLIGASATHSRSAPKLPATPSHQVSPASAEVHVVASGFTQDTSGASSIISYGLILQNASSHVAALHLQLAIALVDAQGRSVASATTAITGIPAGRRFYVGGTAAPNVSLTVAKLDASVTVGSATTRQPVLPSVSNLSLAGYSLAPGIPVPGYGNIAGDLTNPYSVPLASDATIYVVYLNPQGQVVGGASEGAGAQVQPGATDAFSLPGVVVGRASTFEASVDPCVAFGFSMPGSCPATR
ncbi:MAG TPA: DUF4190 domain-containing protein [Candidatus Saccharimonadales bacterium]|nr:DUF4190 domain-containing protein [Candidatus Saccharimonadales bacterium]